jgi:UDPglucose--hexose-1-phosphate uridylyltransferase
MHKSSLIKPDGRRLWLYAREPIPADLSAPSPNPEPLQRHAHMRWHPLRGEWIAYASHRQNRTFLPPPEFNPLAPTVDPAMPTELPSGRYDVAVFENLFPSLVQSATPPPDAIVPTRPSGGSAEVVVFTQDPHTSLGRLPLAHIELIVDVWADRYAELGARDDVQYVFIFENRGVEVGVTLSHPHGQIYAYPFVPPIPQREIEQEQAYFAHTGRTLLADHVASELKEGSRVLYAGDSIAAFVPAFARYSYEVWIAPRAATPSIADLDRSARADLARAFKTILLKYDGLWSQSFPYIMSCHQAPTDGTAHPASHLHFEFYPAYRMRGRLKYLAGSEIGAGVFTADTLPEQTAADLRAVPVDLT